MLLRKKLELHSVWVINDFRNGDSQRHTWLHTTLHHSYGRFLIVDHFFTPP